MLSDVPRSVSPQQQFRDLMRQVEAAQLNGFSHIALGQHFLYGDLRWLQPVPVLARIAAEVDRGVRLVTNIMIGSLYHPVTLAEELATLDIVSEGRLIVGLGIGYRPEEFELLGVPRRERGARLDELIDVMQRLWTERWVDFEGRFFSLSGATPHIQPLQDPHPPIWIGGHTEAGAARAGRAGDGFIVPPGASRDDIASLLAVVEEGFVSRGRKLTATPLRRNVWVSTSREAGMVEYAKVAGERYRAYAKRGLGVYGSHDDLSADFASQVASHAVVGSPADVVGELAGLLEDFPIDPLIVRCGWPSMSGDEVVAQMDLVGRHVIPALA
jgi:alkanesulfonate monooxygenase SsuD/methylene tetrahydromethanopterin reductase-like flavin-dependent oxidoreductase (luciferase family)